MAELFSFSPGRRALVTGGASGLGLGTARRLLDIGATVAIADLPGALDRMAPDEKTRFLAVPMDVTDEASVVARRRRGGQRARAGSTPSSIPPGCSSSAPSRGSPRPNGTASSDVNLRGTFLVMREAMPHLKASGRGRVVNISSDAGKTGFALLGAYCASKFAVVGLTQAIAVEVAPHGVRVNAVCPGTVAETGMGQVVIEQKIELGYGQSPDDVVKRGGESFPLRRVGTVADVVDAILFLISESSGWITGESINIDGGSLAG